MRAYKSLLLRIDSKACNHICEAASVAHRFKVVFYFRGEKKSSWIKGYLYSLPLHLYNSALLPSFRDLTGLCLNCSDWNYFKNILCGWIFRIWLFGCCFVLVCWFVFLFVWLFFFFSLPPSFFLKSEKIIYYQGSKWVLHRLASCHIKNLTFWTIYY